MFVFQQKLWHVELKAKNTLMSLGLLDLQAFVEALLPPTVPFSLSRVVQISGYCRDGTYPGSKNLNNHVIWAYNTKTHAFSCLLRSEKRSVHLNMTDFTGLRVRSSLHLGNRVCRIRTAFRIDLP